MWGKTRFYDHAIQYRKRISWSLIGAMNITNWLNMLKTTTDPGGSSPDSFPCDGGGGEEEDHMSGILGQLTLVPSITWPDLSCPSSAQPPQHQHTTITTTHPLSQARSWSWAWSRDYFSPDWRQSQRSWRLAYLPPHLDTSCWWGQMVITVITVIMVTMVTTDCGEAGGEVWREGGRTWQCWWLTRRHWGARGVPASEARTERELEAGEGSPGTCNTTPGLQSGGEDSQYPVRRSSILILQLQLQSSSCLSTPDWHQGWPGPPLVPLGSEKSSQRVTFNYELFQRFY